MEGRRQLHPADIEFDGRLMRASEPGRSDALRWVLVGMPKIPSEMLRTTIVLYDTEDDAEKGVNPQGSGFLIMRQTDHNKNVGAIYAVTNWHVACRGASVIRFYKPNQEPDIVNLAPHDWMFRPQWHDLAIAPISPKPAPPGKDVIVLPTTYLATPEFIAEREVSPGEDVFMVGLFVDAHGHDTSDPAVRFGNISMMPVNITNANGGNVPTYVIDVHSRPGFSGSPVWVYRRAGGDLSNFNLNMKDQFLSILGIHYAQFPERWKIIRGKKKQEGAEIAELEEDGDYVHGMSGMTKVVPASAILELLEEPKLRAYFDALNVAPPPVDPIGNESVQAA